METNVANSHYSLNNFENYKSTINDTVQDIIEKYYLLINEYLNFISDNVGFKNISYTKFIIERGLETITHVYSILLYYTRNLDVAYFHGQKAFYFYVEFIEQISEDKHSFLQLSSRDASMFVYKKTIFELNGDIRKTIEPLTINDIEKLDVLNLNAVILKSMFCHVLEKDHKMIKHLEFITNEITKAKLNKFGYTIIEVFANLIKKDLHINKYFEIMNLFVVKYSKMKPEAKYYIVDSHMKEKFANPMCEQKIMESSANFVKWILA
jgi:hypothetical protein